MAPRPVYPFCAIVGQEEMKLALILATISPDLSGVLIRGEKGTAKSTAVRGLAALLPKQLPDLDGAVINTNYALGAKLAQQTQPKETVGDGQTKATGQAEGE